jgi:hypothetical protein
MMNGSFEDNLHTHMLDEYEIRNSFDLNGDKNKSFDV